MKKYIYILPLVFTLVLTSCQYKADIPDSDNSNIGKINLLVTENFGNRILFNDSINIKENTSVMDIMKENLDIETAYNGGFVNSINGIKSGYTDKKKRIKKDWFYYINGIISQVGSLDYDVKVNDTILWDYHDWSKKYVSSAVCAFPYGFTNGYGDKKYKGGIIYGDKYLKRAEDIKTLLENKDCEVYMCNINDFSFNTNTNYIFIGIWNEISELKPVQYIMSKKEKTGVFFDINPKIKIYSYDNNNYVEKEKAAIISSFMLDMSSLTRMLLITGNNNTCINKALSVLLNDNESIKGKFSVLVTEKNEIINFPFEK